MKRETIRNFCIIAHIDHGKSTLADRFIEKAKIVDERIGVANQVLDSMDIERERGITIKSQAVSIPYTAKNGRKYTLNLVDTPGHVDFTYEVSRAISACEGALLLIDASQGVEAQTLANMYLAVEHNLEMIPVINKIDLPSADIEAVKHQINRDLGLDAETAVAVSAKIGTGVDELFEKIVELIPPPHLPRRCGSYSCFFRSFERRSNCSIHAQRIRLQNRRDRRFPAAFGTESRRFAFRRRRLSDCRY